MIEIIKTDLPEDRPSGEWVDTGQYPFDKCSKCGTTVNCYEEWNFCPNCGADMRGESDG